MNSFEPLKDDQASADVSAPRARVLVVDDDQRNLLAIRTVIEDLADVETASSGEEALRHLLKGEFAVILLDVYMPGLDGYETAQIIRARDQTKRIPIVFLSAINKEKEHLIRGYTMGAVDYVFKPVDAVVLRSKIAVFVDLFSMTKEIQRKAQQEQRLLDDNLRANAERLRIERELRLVEQRQAAIIRSLPLILYVDAGQPGARKLQFVGGNLEAVAGLDAGGSDTKGDLWTDRLHAEDRERAVRAVGDRDRHGTLAIEYRWRCADGEYRHFLDQAVRLQTDDGSVSYAGTLLDVTDRKELESQLTQAQKMDAIGKLTGGIAHDFNNLLAAVLGGIGLIERRLPLQDEHRKIIDMTRRAAEQGSELVGRLLAFARRQQLQPALINVNDLAGNASELLTHTLGGLVTLEWRRVEGLWPAFADQNQLELALMNLVINARDAMPKGGTVSVVPANASLDTANLLGLPAGDYVRIPVIDTGTGIPQELIEKVTEPFFTTKGVGEGTGLGLSMVYGFVRQSGGTLHIESELGNGTTIEIWLPRALEEKSTTRPALAEVAEMESTQAALSVLVVDDHDGVREATAGMLVDLGHAVHTAADAKTMLEMLDVDPEQFDLVVTDYAMPLMSGTEMIRQARRLNPTLKALLVSGYPDREAIADVGKDLLILHKPFTIEALRVMIAKSTGQEI